MGLFLDGHEVTQQSPYGMNCQCKILEVQIGNCFILSTILFYTSNLRVYL